MTPPRFFGPHELAERWGVSRQRIKQMVDEGKIPPGELLKGTRVWSAEEITAYEQESGRSDIETEIRGEDRSSGRKE